MKVIPAICLIFLSSQITKTQSQVCELLADWSSSDISSQCMEQMMTVCNNGSLWWRMFDASSKFPISGMSYSSNADLGNYDECVTIDYQGTIKGKFCAYSVVIVTFLEGIPNPYKADFAPKALAEYSKLNYTYYNLDYRELRKVENTATLLSICVPDKCTPKEVGMFFVWGRLSDLSELGPVIFADAAPCMMKDSYSDFRVGDTVFLVFLIIIVCLLFVCTLYDFLLQKLNQKPHHPMFLAFSIITNGKKLLHTTNTFTSEQIGCLNGLRYISILWVIAGHGYIALESAPVVNYAAFPALQDDIQFNYILSGPIAVDTFFVLSGFLLTFGYLKIAVNFDVLRHIVGVPMMIIHRYLRLTPALAVLYFTCITIFRMLGNGPLWGVVSDLLENDCKKHWWSFFLYVQNYVNPGNICLNHTWYLSADMQMFILSPFVLIPVALLIKENKRNHVYVLLSGLIFLSVVLPIASRFIDETITNDYETHARFNDYLIGMLLGVIMRDPRFKKFPFNKLVNLAIWCFVLVCDVAFWLYYHNVLRVYNHTTSTLFYGLYRPVWSFSVIWFIYSCYHGYGGPVNWFLSLSPFQVGARLSYCMYLLHGVVMMYYIGLVRTQYYLGYHVEFYLFSGHLIVTMLLSAVWSLAFESPMIVIERFIFGGGARKPVNQARS